MTWVIGTAVLIVVPVLIGGWDIISPAIAPIIAACLAVAAVISAATWRSNRSIRAALRRADRSGLTAWPVQIQLPGARAYAGVLEVSDVGLTVSTKRGEVALAWGDVSDIAANVWMLGFWFWIERRRSDRLSVAVLTDSTLQLAGRRANQQCIAALTAARAVSRAAG